MKLTINLYPNNEVRTSLSPDTRPRRKKKESIWQCLPSDDGGHFFVPNETHETQPAESGGRSNLDISSDFQESAKPGWGGLPRKTVFGLYGKRTILRVGGVFDRKFPKHECVFLTGTLPGSTPEAVEVMARYSGYIVNLLKTWVKYYAGEEYSFYAWEWQRRGALHIHYCVRVHNSRSRQLLIERFHDEWVSILKQVSDKSGVDAFARAIGGSWQDNAKGVQCDAQVVHTSVAAYVSKYCAKGHDTGKAFHCPSRWWGCSRAALHSLQEMTLTLRLDSLSMRRALQLFEDVIHITESRSNKSYIYRHGTGYGVSQVAFHHQSDTSENIWITLLSTLTSSSMNCSAMRKNQKTSEVRTFVTSFWSLSQNSSDALCSAPLAAKVHEYLVGYQSDSVFTVTDWREFFSICCLQCSDSSSRLSWTRLKHKSLTILRKEQTKDYVQRIE